MLKIVLVSRQPKQAAIHIVALIRPGLLSLSISVLLGVSACGEPELPPKEIANEDNSGATIPDISPSSQMEYGGGQGQTSLVNFLSFEATGDAEASLESDGSDLILTGGCIDRNVIGMSFTRGQITAKDLFQVRLRTADSVGAGEVGSFPVSELGWYDGQFAPDDLPSGASILIPDAYEGSGTLTLTRHEKGGRNGRLVGTVEGTVKQLGGSNEVFVKASFDINLGCSNASMDGMN